MNPKWPFSVLCVSQHDSVQNAYAKHRAAVWVTTVSVLLLYWATKYASESTSAASLNFMLVLVLQCVDAIAKAIITAPCTVYSPLRDIACTKTVEKRTPFYSVGHMAWWLVSFATGSMCLWATLNAAVDAKHRALSGDGATWLLIVAACVMLMWRLVVLHFAPFACPLLQAAPNTQRFDHPITNVLQIKETKTSFPAAVRVENVVPHAGEQARKLYKRVPNAYLSGSLNAHEKGAAPKKAS